MKKGLKKLCFALMLAGMLVIMCGCGSKKINLNDYLTYEVTGANGYGQITYKFDEGAFENDLIAISGMSGWNDMDTLYRVETAVEDGSWDKKDGLKNGDVVTYSWNVNPKMIKERYNVVFKFKSIKLKVEGLEEVGTFDPFENIDIKVSGSSPNGTLEIEKTGEDMDGFYYEADKTTELKNGEEVTIKFSFHDYADDIMIAQCANTLGKVPERTEMTYTVEGLDSYVESASQIPDETMNAMIEEAETDIRAYIASDWDNPNDLQDIQYLGCYVMSAKDLSESWWSDFTYNRVYIVHKITAKNENTSGSFDYFYFTEFKNLLAKADGSVEVDLNNTSIPDGGYGFLGVYGTAFSAGNYTYVGYSTYEELYNDIVTAQADNYTIEDNVAKPDNAVYYEDVLKPEEE